eukprot:9313846-Alexandrium_andersonii.AAC.1
MCIRDRPRFQGASDFARPRANVPGPSRDLVQRCLGLCTTSYTGTRTFARPRTKLPKPSWNIVQRCPGLRAFVYAAKTPTQRRAREGSVSYTHLRAHETSAHL